MRLKRHKPGRNKATIHLQSSCRQRCRTRRNSLAPKTMWPTVFSQKIHIRLRPPLSKRKNKTKKWKCCWMLKTSNKIESKHTWCPLHISSKSCIRKNRETTSAPNVKLTPRSFSPQSFTSLSGSDHNRSHNRPVSGTSVGRTIRRICSMSCKSGLKPPWQQNIFSSIIAAMGKQLKQSVNVFHNLML